MSTRASSFADRLLTTADTCVVGREIPCASLDPLDRKPAQDGLLEHARPCFDRASRHARAALGPGSLTLLAKPTIFGTVSDSRAGKPVAIALAMLEEGCINDSEAAAEAAVEALQRPGPRAEFVLDRITADAPRHAALAWRTLRWLLDSHPEVAPALPLAVPMRSTVMIARTAVIARLVARLAHPIGAVGVVVTSGPALA
jgi:hypothetical protein